jgi:hypothetical protein
MRLRSYIILLFTIGCFYTSEAQQQKSGLTADLQGLFTRIFNTHDDTERLRLNDSVKLLVDTFVASDSVMTYNFEHLRYPGQITSSDSRLRIITWNIILSDDSNKYFLYLVRKGEKGNRNRVYKLTGQNRPEAPESGRVYSEKDWYGALYYAVQPFKIKRKTYYILLGLDFGNPYTSRKIIDILSFNDDGSITFGKDCLERGHKIKDREVIEYSPEGVITLRIESKKEIVFDHIVPYSAGHEEEAENYGAGLSFDGYILKKGIWRFVSNIDVKNRK